MADLTVTAANVAEGSGAKKTTGTAGATITAGQTVYKDAADSNKIKLADADLSQAASTVVGIALHAALSGQPITYQTDGQLDVGATLTVGEIYVLSGTAGGIAPVADLAASDWVVILGVALATDNLDVQLYIAGIQQ